MEEMCSMSRGIENIMSEVRPSCLTESFTWKSVESTHDWMKDRKVACLEGESQTVGIFNHRTREERSGVELESQPSDNGAGL